MSLGSSAASQATLNSSSNNGTSSARVESSDDVVVCCNMYKTLWKPRITLDVVIVLHKRLNCFEIVVYNPELDKEAPRIYIDGARLYSHIADEAEEIVAKRREKVLRSKQRSDDNAVRMEVVEQLSLKFLTARLGVDPTANASDASFMVLLPQTGDIVVDEEARRLDVVLPQRPAAIQPVAIEFEKRQKVTSQDVKKLLHEMECQLRQASCLAELTANSTNIFNSMIRQSFQWKMFKPARLRWVKAINRVIIMNTLDKLRARWDSMNAAATAAAARAAHRAAAHADGRAHPEQPKRPRILRRKHNNTDISPRLAVAKPMEIQAHGQTESLHLPDIHPHSSGAISTSQRTQRIRSSSRSDRSTFHFGDDCSSIRTVTDRYHAPLESSPLSTKNSPRGYNCLESSGPVPSLTTSFQAKSTISPRPLPNHRPYILRDAIARACGDNFVV